MPLVDELVPLVDERVPLVDELVPLVDERVPLGEVPVLDDGVRVAADDPEVLPETVLDLLLDEDRGAEVAPVPEEVELPLPDDFDELLREVVVVRLAGSSSAETAIGTAVASIPAASSVITLSFRMVVGPGTGGGIGDDFQTLSRGSAREQQILVNNRFLPRECGERIAGANLANLNRWLKSDV